MQKLNLVSFENTYVQNHDELSQDPFSKGALACVTIDGFPEDDEAGQVVAVVWMTRARQFIVDWHDNGYRMNESVLEKIQESKDMLEEMYPSADTEKQGYTVECYIRDIGLAFHAHRKSRKDADDLAYALIKSGKVSGCAIVEDETHRLLNLLGYCGY